MLEVGGGLGLGSVPGRHAVHGGVQRESDESLVASPSVTQLFLALCVKAVVRFAVDFKGRRAGDSNPDVLAHGGFQDRCLTS